MRDWLIHITCQHKPMGPPILVTGWEVLTKLACVEAILPEGWTVEAYPVIPRNPARPECR